MATLHKEERNREKGKHNSDQTAVLSVIPNTCTASPSLRCVAVLPAPLRPLRAAGGTGRLRQPAQLPGVPGLGAPQLPPGPALPLLRLLLQTLCPPGENLPQQTTDTKLMASLRDPPTRLSAHEAGSGHAPWRTATLGDHPPRPAGSAGRSPAPARRELPATPSWAHPTPPRPLPASRVNLSGPLSSRTRCACAAW